MKATSKVSGSGPNKASLKTDIPLPLNQSNLTLRIPTVIFFYGSMNKVSLHNGFIEKV